MAKANNTLILILLKTSLVNVSKLTYDKEPFESGKFTLKIESAIGKLCIIGCRLPPISTHVVTLDVRTTQAR